MEPVTRVDGATAAKILVAAADVFRENPGASMETVAARAGLSRATVHRHFTTRSDMLAALREQAVEVVAAALDPASADNEPPVVRLYNVTRKLLEAKIDWSWVLRDLEAGPEVTGNPVLANTVEWMRYLDDHGYLAAEVDRVWAATVYLTLVKAATTPLHDEDSAARRSARAVDAFVHGVGSVDVRYLSDRSS